MNAPSQQAQCEESPVSESALKAPVSLPRRAAGDSFKVPALKLQESVIPQGLQLCEDHFYTTLAAGGNHQVGAGRPPEPNIPLLPVLPCARPAYTSTG